MTYYPKLQMIHGAVAARETPFRRLPSTDHSVSFSLQLLVSYQWPRPLGPQRPIRGNGAYALGSKPMSMLGARMHTLYAECTMQLNAFVARVARPAAVTRCEAVHDHRNLPLLFRLAHVAPPP